MRPARMLLGTALVLTLAWPAPAQSVLFQATVKIDGAEVRCKPGIEPAVYATQKLPRGTLVQVVEKLPDGWLKIDPPRGSFSWVNTRALRPADGVPGVWIVGASDGPVPVLVGSPYKPGKPDVVGTTLARGAQVIAVGEPRPSEEQDGHWLPVLPPPGEYRYLREAEVSVAAGGPTTVAAAGWAAKAGGAETAAPSAAGKDAPKALPPQPTQEVHVPAPAPAADPLLQQAQQLERAGEGLAAARLYDQLGNKYTESNHEVAVQYYNRAAWLRGSSAPAAQPAPTLAETLYQQARQYEQAGNRADAAQIYARLGDLFKDRDYSLSMQYYNRAAWLRQGQPAPPRASPTPPTGGTPPATTGAAAPPSTVVQARAQSVQSAGVGFLKRSAYSIDGRTTYVLESPQAQVIAYLTPQAGVDLERYVGQNIEAFGQFVTRTDTHDKYMTVATVRLLTPQQ